MPLHCILLPRFYSTIQFHNPFNAKSNPICHLLALLGAPHILHVSRIRVKMTDSWDVTSHRLTVQTTFRAQSWVTMQLGPPIRREWLQSPHTCQWCVRSPTFSTQISIFLHAILDILHVHGRKSMKQFFTAVFRSSNYCLAELGNFLFHRAAKRIVSTLGKPPRIRSTSSPLSTEFVNKIFSDLDSIMSSYTTLVLDTCCLATWHAFVEQPTSEARSNKQCDWQS